MSISISRSDMVEQIKEHYPAPVAEAIIAYWAASWRGAQIYVPSRPPTLPATSLWWAGTRETIIQAGGTAQDADKLFVILGGLFVRF